MNPYSEQPILSVKAHVYHIDRQTRKSWIMVSKQALPVSFFFDKQRNVYRIISVEGTRAVINSIVANSTVVRKTSHKFVQWADQRTDIVYGLGFAAESDVILFVEKFTQIKQKVAAAAAAAFAGNHPDQALSNSDRLPHNSDHGESSSLSRQQKLSRPTRCSSAQPHNLSQSLTQHCTPRSNSNDHLPAFCESAEELLRPGSQGRAGDVDQIRNENARLVAALRKSAENVKKWEQELQRLREENRRLSEQQKLDANQRRHEQFNSLPSSLKNRRSNSGGRCNDIPHGSRESDTTTTTTKLYPPNLTYTQTFSAKFDAHPSNNSLSGENLREQLRSIENVYDQVLLQNRHLHSILQDGRQRLVRVIAEVDDLAMSEPPPPHYRHPSSSSTTTAAAADRTASTLSNLSDVSSVPSSVKKQLNDDIHNVNQNNNNDKSV